MWRYTVCLGLLDKHILLYTAPKIIYFPIYNANVGSGGDKIFRGIFRVVSLLYLKNLEYILDSDPLHIWEHLWRFWNIFGTVYVHCTVQYVWDAGPISFFLNPPRPEVIPARFLEQKCFYFYHLFVDSFTSAGHADLGRKYGRCFGLLRHQALMYLYQMTYIFQAKTTLESIQDFGKS